MILEIEKLKELDDLYIRNLNIKYKIKNQSQIELLNYNSVFNGNDNRKMEKSM